MKTERNQTRWGVAAVVAIALLALVPQLSFIVDRGREWHGANAITHTDEVAYSTYVASLIRGRPRRNDPYTGRQDTAAARAPESLFSIQMVPAYALAVPAQAKRSSGNGQRISRNHLYGEKRFGSARGSSVLATGVRIVPARTAANQRGNICRVGDFVGVCDRIRTVPFTSAIDDERELRNKRKQGDRNYRGHAPSRLVALSFHQVGV